MQSRQPTDPSAANLGGGVQSASYTQGIPIDVKSVFVKYRNRLREWKSSESRVQNTIDADARIANHRRARELREELTELHRELINISTTYSKPTRQI